MSQVEAEVGEFGNRWQVIRVVAAVVQKQRRVSKKINTFIVTIPLSLFSVWMMPSVFAQDLQGSTPSLIPDSESAEKKPQSPVLEAPRIFESRSLGPFDSVLKDDPAEPTKLSHTIYLDSYRGVPSRFSLRVSSLQELAKVQITVISDGNLLVVPMRWEPSAGMFQAVVPTPEISFEYTFQLAFSSGKTLSTQQFTVSEACLKRPTDKVFAENSPEKRELLRELIELDRETAQLGYVVTAIEDIKQRIR